LTALTTARSDAVTMLASRPTPHRVLPPLTRASTYAAALALAWRLAGRPAGAERHVAGAIGALRRRLGFPALAAS